MTRRQFYDQIKNNMVQVRTPGGKTMGMDEYAEKLDEAAKMDKEPSPMDAQIVVTIDFPAKEWVVFEVEPDPDNEQYYLGRVEGRPSERILAMPRTWAKKREREES